MSGPVANTIYLKQVGVRVNKEYHASKSDITLEQAEIDAAKADPAAFRVLYDRYYERIFRYIYQRLDDKDLAFDAVSQVFLKALNNIGKYEHRGLPFASWLYRIAKSELNNAYKEQKTQRTVNIETLKVQSMIDDLDEESNDEAVAVMIEQLKELPDSDIQMIEMRFFEGRPFKEIAEILNITENNAKVKTYRILDRMKKKLGTHPAFKQKGN